MKTKLSILFGILFCINSLAAVTFTFQDVGNEYASGVLNSPNNSINVKSGDTFEFDIWMNASEGEQVAGYDFQLNFVEFLHSSITFTLESNLNRNSSLFSYELGEFTAPEPLTPLNTIPNQDYGTPLGALLPVDINWVTSVLYIGKATLRIDSSMPEGIYHISPSGMDYMWIDYVNGPINLSDDSFTPYTVNVIPESNYYELAFTLGLIGFAYQRLMSKLS